MHDGQVCVRQELLTAGRDAEAVDLDIFGVGHLLAHLVRKVSATHVERVVVLLHGLLLRQSLLSRRLELLLTSLTFFLLRLTAEDNLLLLALHSLGLVFAPGGGEIHIVHVPGRGGLAALQHRGRAARRLALLGRIGGSLLRLLLRLLGFPRRALLGGLVGPILLLLLLLLLCRYEREGIVEGASASAGASARTMSEGRVPSARSGGAILGTVGNRPVGDTGRSVARCARGSHLSSPSPCAWPSPRASRPSYP